MNVGVFSQIVKHKGGGLAGMLQVLLFPIVLAVACLSIGSNEARAASPESVAMGTNNCF